MKKIFNFVIASLAVAALATSCLKEGEPLAKSVIVDKIELTPFEAAGSPSQTIKVTADGDWVAGAPSWIQLSAYAGNGDATITVSPKENRDANGEMLAPRSGVITVSGSSATNVIKVRQRGDKGKSLVIYPTLSIKEFKKLKDDASAFYHLKGTICDTTYNNYKTYGNFYMTDGQDTILVYGLTATKKSSNDKSYASLGLRLGSQVSLAGYRSSYKGDPQVGGAYVYDPEKQNIQISPESFDAEIAGSNFVLDIIARGTYTVNPSADWIVCGAPDADHQVAVQVKANDGNAPRSGKITVTVTIGETTQSVECNISQMCNEPETATAIADVPASNAEAIRVHGTVVMSTGGNNGYILGGGNNDYLFVYYNNSYAVGDSVKVVGKNASYSLGHQFAPYFDAKLGKGKFRTSNPTALDSLAVVNLIENASSTNLLKAHYVTVPATVFADGSYQNAKELAGTKYGARLYLGKGVNIASLVDKKVNLIGWIVAYESNKTRVRFYLEKAEEITGDIAQ